MTGGIWFLTLLYFIIIIGVIGFILHLGSRFVKAIEKISDIYERKNISTNQDIASLHFKKQLIIQNSQIIVKTDSNN